MQDLAARAIVRWWQLISSDSTDCDFDLESVPGSGTPVSFAADSLQMRSNSAAPAASAGWGSWLAGVAGHVLIVTVLLVVAVVNRCIKFIRILDIKVSRPILRHVRPPSGGCEPSRVRLSD